MIPLKLELKNFLSYGSQTQTIDFGNHSLICLSGKNGNGKSALLDAMTWVLWGQARKTSGTVKADAGLMRLGQTQMMVSLEFLCDGNRYRVRREYAKTYGKPYAALDIELFDESKEKFFPLTDKTIRKSQEQIEKIIGLDFETFVNSAFLRQGMSDEFSKKSPKERKQILGSILGLGLYDQLNQKSLDRVRAYSDEKKFLEKLQETGSQELSKEEEVTKKLCEIKSAMTQLDDRQKKLELERDGQEKERHRFSGEMHRFDALERRKLELEEDSKLKKEKFRLLYLEWKEFHRKSLLMPDRDSLEKKRDGLRGQELKFRTVQQEVFAKQEELLKIQGKYQKLYGDLKRGLEIGLQLQKLKVETKGFGLKQTETLLVQKKSASEDLKEKQKRLEKEIFGLKKDLSVFEKFSKEYEAIKRQFEKRRIFYQNFVQRGNWLSGQLRELANKKTAIGQPENPACPVCEQVLTVQRKKFLSQRFTVDECLYSRRVTRVKAVLSRLKILLVDQHREVERMGFERERFQQALIRSESNEKLLSEIIEKIEKCDLEIEMQKVQVAHMKSEQKKESKKLENLEKTIEENLDKDQDVIALKSRIDALNKEIGKKEIDRSLLTKISEELSQLEGLLKEDLSEKNLNDGQRERKMRAGGIIEELRRYKKEEEKLSKALVGLNKAKGQQEALLKEINKNKIDQKELLDEKGRIALQIGQLESEAKHIERLKRGIGERQKKIEEITSEIDDYQELAKAFGKNGIQALLIEDAIPEIENEANELLSKLTENQSQVFIESLRDLKSGGVRESLDIHISDSVGIRPYEMFSGGEAFRIDFALRIAISKLLARRAGATLQTLIIDEGFGSQDEEGLQRLMDALYSIQNDFSRIIVVSHLPVFKDNFPIHFQIQKTPSGSMISVEERG